VSDDPVIGVDVGGTKILAAVVDRRGQIAETRERPTPLESQDALVEAIYDAIGDLLEPGVAALGVGVPSRIDQAKGVAHGSVNIPLRELPLRDLVARRFSLPVGIENDANAAAFAEWAFGAAHGSNDMVMLTLGTGVGGGAVIGSRLYRGWAEFGHIVVEFDGKPCQGTCTGRGHLESYCTGLAAGEAAEHVFGPGTDAHKLVALGRAGDTRALEILDLLGRRLGAGIGSLVNIFDPQVVVVGGGFGAAAAELVLAPAREIMKREALAPAGERVQIVPARLGPEAGVIGAALVAYEALADAG